MKLNDIIDEDGNILEELIDLLPIPVFYKSKDGIYLGCNQLFQEAINLSKKEIVGKTSFDLYTKKLALYHNKKNDKLFSSGKIQVYDGVLALHDGTSPIFRFHKSMYSNKLGEPIGFICAAICIKGEKRLEGLAMYESLTGLFNRGYGLDLLSKKLQECKDKKEILSLVIMDIDYFKKINDNYGHAYGDQVLKKVSEVLKSNLRTQDILFRYGGEEFIYVLPSTNIKQAYSISKRIGEEISQILLVSEEKTKIKVSASFGISSFPQNGKTEDQLIKKADNAMYKIKNNGRNGVGIAIE